MLSMQRSRTTSNPRPATLHRRLPLALLPVVLVAAPAMAQRDSVQVRAVSTWQTDVDRLRQELLTQRRMELEFSRTLGSLQARLRAVPADSERIDLQARSQLLFGKLRESSAAQVRIRRQIESLCAAMPRPAGWLGVATTGVSAVLKEGDGPQVVRYLERPVIESVDPGSPADRAGVRAGDVLLEIGGKALLNNNIVFAELLRPGERVTVKVQRGRDVVTMAPLVEPVPQSLSSTPCLSVDAGTAYVLAPMPASQVIQVDVDAAGEPSQRKFVFTTPRVRRDSARVEQVDVAPPPGGAVFAGPMAYTYSGGTSVLAGLQLIALNQESSRALGVSHGLFVNQVAPGTMGREAGLQGGDVLVSADSIDLRSVRSLQRAIQASHDRSVTIVIVRDRRQETVTLKW